MEAEAAAQDTEMTAQGHGYLLNSGPAGRIVAADYIRPVVMDRALRTTLAACANTDVAPRGRDATHHASMRIGR
jgi:hypothetical protein